MIYLYCDGLTEPVNPGGIACYGWVAYRDGERLAEGSAVVCSGPGATNNVAEYSAVIAGLEWLLKNGYQREEVVVRSDSQLCIYQLAGRYAVRSPRLWPLFSRARELASQFRRVRFEWVPRSRNAEADLLSRRAYANAALKEQQEQRVRKAVELVPLVRRLDEFRYTVPSQSEPGNMYVVDVVDGTCTCADFIARRRMGLKCKHLLAVEMACSAQDAASS